MLVLDRVRVGLLTVLTCLTSASWAAADDVRVTVVAILATTKEPAEVHPKLAGIALEVQKHDPSLKSFYLKKTTCLPIPVGKTEKFPLVDDQFAEVTVHNKANKEGKVCLVVKAPKLGEITYKTTCDKYFPILTRYHTKDNGRLIVAIMVPPCP